MTYGLRLKLARKAAGLTQEKLADSIHAKRQSISQWEKNLAMPSIDKVSAICEQVHVSPCHLLGISKCGSCAAENSAITAAEYQRLSARTINDCLSPEDMERHALFGLAAEVGEILGMYQKEYQGHDVDPDHLREEIGDVMWMLTELCTVNDFDLGEIMMENVEKLRKRYPDGFDENRSLHRPDE